MQIRDRIKELRRVRAGDLVPNPRNWRSHPQTQQDALRGVLAEIGYADALLVRELPDGRLEIVDGHLRAETTPDEVVPVLVLDVTEEEADKLMLTLDPLAAMAEANKEALGRLLQEIETQSPAVQAMLDNLAAEYRINPEVEGLTDPDEIPEPPDEAITQPGDLWIMGDHRLLCGDSSKPEDVDRLLGGATIQLVNTDPPYNVAVEPRTNNAMGLRRAPRDAPARTGRGVWRLEPAGGGRGRQAENRPQDAGPRPAAEERLRLRRGVRPPPERLVRQHRSRAGARPLLLHLGRVCQLRKLPAGAEGPEALLRPGDHLGQGAPGADPQGLHGKS